MTRPSVLERYSDYEVVIGIEVHVQLTTKSKIFCLCANEFSKEPNKNICPICVGHPGVLPVLNKQAVDYAIMAGQATNCSINRISTFDRKHYMYPDLPKGYQITQNDEPICIEGFVPIRLEDGSIKKIRLIRIHIEEDAGKNLHATDRESFVDLNRAGTPLLEIVSYPDISSAHEAKAYLRILRLIVQYLHICSGNMEEGAFRADTNISVRKKGEQKLGTKVELKNINSFKFIGDAIEYEIERQIEVLESKGKILQETRLWDTKNNKTVTMRLKEELADYRYFEEPDLPLIETTDEWINRIKSYLPELPHEKFDRLCKQGLTPYEADILIDDLELARYYEKARKHTQSKQLINWVLRDLIAWLKEQKISAMSCKVSPEYLAALVDLIDNNVINNQVAKQVFEIAAQTGKDPKVIVEEKGLKQIGSASELKTIVEQVLKESPQEVARYKQGEAKLLGFFVGQAMKKTGGKANPKMIQDILRQILD